jgi:Tol biopolymer transport system component
MGNNPRHILRRWNLFMNKGILSHLILILLPFMAGCSINVGQGATPTASLPDIGTAAPASPTTASAQAGKIGNPALPTTTIPVTWGDLHLSGTLVYMNSIQTTSTPIMSIQAIDLATGVITTIFQAEQGGWIDFMSVSPDANRLVMAYLPPRGSDLSPNAGQQALYTLPLDGSQPPKLLFPPPSNGYQYYQPTWSPDGRYVYFSYVDYSAPPRVAGQHFSFYELSRVAYPGGQPEKLVDEGFWPRLSKDGARLAYVTVNPVDGSNKLFVANPDGSGAYEVPLTGLYVPPIIDAPFFTPDGQTLLYSAISPTQSSRPNWIEKLLGILVASAHTVPSDWWSVPIGGGAPTQLTHIAAVGLFASLSPDENTIASYSGTGIFVMNPDGTGLTMVIPDMGGLAGTLSWIP